MILGGFRRLAPVAGDIKIGGVVGPAVFQRYDVLERPAVARPELALADVALALTQGKDLGPLLCGEALAGLVRERVAHGPCSPCSSQP